MKPSFVQMSIDAMDNRWFPSDVLTSTVTDPPGRTGPTASATVIPPMWSAAPSSPTRPGTSPFSASPRMPPDAARPTVKTEVAARWVARTGGVSGWPSVRFSTVITYVRTPSSLWWAATAVGTAKAASTTNASNGTTRRRYDFCIVFSP